MPFDERVHCRPECSTLLSFFGGSLFRPKASRIPARSASFFQKRTLSRDPQCAASRISAFHPLRRPQSPRGCWCDAAVQQHGRRAETAWPAERFRARLLVKPSPPRGGLATPSLLPSISKWRRTKTSRSVGLMSLRARCTRSGVLTSKRFQA
jgi:hypothetical protein